MNVGALACFVGCSGENIEEDPPLFWFDAPPKLKGLSCDEVWDELPPKENGLSFAAVFEDPPKLNEGAAVVAFELPNMEPWLDGSDFPLNEKLGAVVD